MARDRELGLRFVSNHEKVDVGDWLETLYRKCFRYYSDMWKMFDAEYKRKGGATWRRLKKMTERERIKYYMATTSTAKSLTRAKRLNRPQARRSSVKLLLKSMSGAEVARRLGITRQRVHQLANSGRN